MRARITYTADRLRNSYWFTPGLMTIGAVLLSAATLAIDEHRDPEETPFLHSLVYSGGPDGAREVLSVIAGSMITVAGVVFSITIVALTLASSQFGPRLLANFMRDRGNQIVLGTFISAFLYSLLVLRIIRSGDVNTVPHLSVTVALLLAIAGLVVLIYFIHHVSMMIQAPNLIASIRSDLHHGIGHLFPDPNEAGHDLTDRAAPQLPAGFEDDALPVPARGSGYIDVIDLDGLVDIAREHGLVVRLERRPGQYVVRGTPIARAWPATRLDETVTGHIAEAVLTGSQRTPVQDIEFPIEQMVEIAVRALSPSINDPITANTCLDQLSAELCELAGRELPATHLTDGAGQVRVLIGDPLTFERVIGGAFDQIRQCASMHATVYLHMLDSLTRIAGCVRSPDRLDALLRHGNLVIERAREAVAQGSDRAVIEDRYDDLVRATASAGRA